MDKQIFLNIVNLYKKEENITRLVYRLIKYEYEANPKDKTKWLSKKQLFNRTIKIIYSKEEIDKEQERVNKSIKDIFNEKIKFLQDKGFIDIKIVDDYSYYYKDNTTNALYYGNINKEAKDVNESYFKDIYMSVNSSIEKLLSINYIKAYEVKNANPTGKKFINTGKTIRYKPLK